MVSKMYEDGAEGNQDMSFVGGGSSIREKLGNMETIIPIVVILIIGAFVLDRMGIVDIPLIGRQKPASLLIIGSLSPESLDALAELRGDVVTIRPSMDVQQLYNRANVIFNYDIIILDQSNEAEKGISRKLSEALKAFVQKGGKLIIVKNSGIRRLGDDSVLGWKANFGDLVPVECSPDEGELAGCLNESFIRARLYQSDVSHPIMKGLTVLPSTDKDPMIFSVYNVSCDKDSVEIAYFIDELKNTYVGICEKKALAGLGGTVIYFNYDPGKLPTVFQNTIKYLAGRPI